MRHMSCRVTTRFAEPHDTVGDDRLWGFHPVRRAAARNRDETRYVVVKATKGSGAREKRENGRKRSGNKTKSGLQWPSFLELDVPLTATHSSTPLQVVGPAQPLKLISEARSVRFDSRFSPCCFRCRSPAFLGSCYSRSWVV